MAANERTERATPKRRDEARKKGQVARSPDLSGALIMLAAISVIGADGTHIAESLAGFMRSCLHAIGNPQLFSGGKGLSIMGEAALNTLTGAFMPIAGACVGAALLAGAAQAGGRPHLGALRFDAKRLNPVSGIKGLLSPNALFEGAKALVKLAAVGTVAASVLIPGTTGLAHKVGMAPLALSSLAGSQALEVAQHIIAAYLLIGIGDYAWRRMRTERMIRMTKQEVRDEVRQYSISAEVKRVIKRKQAQLARARMMAAVPEADVVVTNPTHYAVALRYDGSKPAPEVVAKGQELIAAQIRRIAAEHGVPVISDPPLARAIYADTEVGQIIPAELYVAVARVLAFVYRLAKRSPALRRPALASGAIA